MNAMVPSKCCSGAEGWVFRRSRLDQWQVLQDPPAQPEHEDAPVPIRELAAPLSPPLLNPHTDIIFRTSAQSHLGQFTDSSLLNTRVSNSSPHLQH